MANIIANYGKENGFSGISVEENYHMNLDALKAFMPEKYRLLEELHDEIGGTFCKNSTPVYDVNTGRIYFSMGLDRISGTSDYASIFIKVRESLNNGIPVKGFWAKGKHLRYKEGYGSYYENRYDNVEGHIFLAVEDLPIKVLRNAVRNQLASLKWEIDNREEEMQKAKNFCSAASELDKAIKEAKELLK